MKGLIFIACVFTLIFGNPFVKEFFFPDVCFLSSSPNLMEYMKNNARHDASVRQIHARAFSLLDHLVVSWSGCQKIVIVRNPTYKENYLVDPFEKLRGYFVHTFLKESTIVVSGVTSDDIVRLKDTSSVWKMCTSHNQEVSHHSICISPSRIKSKYQEMLLEIDDEEYEESANDLIFNQRLFTSLRNALNKPLVNEQFSVTNLIEFLFQEIDDGSAEKSAKQKLQSKSV